MRLNSKVVGKLIACLLLCAFAFGCSPPSSSVEAPTLTANSIGFASKEKLTQHFQKHGAEFGCKNEVAYLKLAQTLRDKPVGGAVLEAQRSDETITRFDRSSGAFLAFNPDKVIRTFFKPNDGEAYFKRQLRRTH
jgi:pyocin large subunit-like protein